MKRKRLMERIITEANAMCDLHKDWWAGKRSCWEMSHCPDLIRKECPARKFTFLPCWEIEGTYCKLNDKGVRGDDTGICETCCVYERWGDGQPIKIKLFGRGISTNLSSLVKAGIR
jgi:hypothetical protein